MLSKKVFRTSENQPASRSRKRPVVEEKRPSSSELNTPQTGQKALAKEFAEAPAASSEGRIARVAPAVTTKPTKARARATVRRGRR